MEKQLDNLFPPPRRGKSENVILGIFFFLYLLTASVNTAYFFSDNSAMRFYYEVLMATNIYFLIPYCCNALSVILNVFALLPFYLYIRRIDFLSIPFWKGLFIVRLGMDLVGRSYELNMLKSMFYQSPRLAFFVLATALFLSLPSYVALYRYAFKKHI